MEQLIELFDQIEQLAKAGGQALKQATGEGGGAAPEGGAPQGAPEGGPPQQQEAY